MKLVVMAVAALAVFALDQASKWWVMEVLDLGARRFIEIAPILNFAFVLNTGVNFGIFASDGMTQQYVLAAFAVAVSIGLAIWTARSDDVRFAAAAGFVIGGALGNAVDRVTVGGVIDFLNFDCCGIGNPFAFNVADAAIFVGAIGIALLLWREEPAKSEG